MQQVQQRPVGRRRRCVGLTSCMAWGMHVRAVAMQLHAAMRVPKTVTAQLVMHVHLLPATLALPAASWRLLVCSQR